MGHVVPLTGCPVLSTSTAVTVASVIATPLAAFRLSSRIRLSDFTSRCGSAIVGSSKTFASVLSRAALRELLRIDVRGEHGQAPRRAGRGAGRGGGAGRAGQARRAGRGAQPAGRGAAAGGGAG